MKGGGKVVTPKLYLINIFEIRVGEKKEGFSMETLKSRDPKILNTAC
jgi:hypothetical protein